MAGGINEFVGQFNGGGARPNRFEVTLGGGGANTHFFCKAASLPASTMGKCEVPYMSRVVVYEGDRTFADWTVTVYNDLDFGVRDSLIQFMENRNGHEDNAGRHVYIEDTEVRQLSRQNIVRKTYKFTNLIITEVGEIALAWDSNDQVEEFEVTMAYNYWT